MTSRKSRPRTDALNTVLVDAVDEDLKAEARAIVRALLADARRTIAIGDRKDKDQMMRAVLPGLLRDASTEKDSSEEELRAAFERIKQQVNNDDPTAADHL